MPFNADGKYVKGELSFDPRTVLIKVKGSQKADYLEVKYRLVMLREQFPESTLVTKMLFHDLDSKTVIMHTTITLPTGAVGTGIKMEERSDFRDYVEKAETGSVGRALYAVGIGLQYSNVEYDYEAESKKDFIGVDGPVNNPALTGAQSKSAPAAPAPTPGKKPSRQSIMEQLAAAAERLTPEVIAAKSESLFHTAQASKLSLEELQKLIDWADDQINEPPLPQGTLAA